MSVEVNPSIINVEIIPEIIQVNLSSGIGPTGPKGDGSVLDVSIVSANGFSGSVANATTSPDITISTTVTGILKGNGSSVSSAVSGIDYASPIHSHNISDISNLQTTLNSKSNLTHTHGISDVSGLQSALDGKASLTHLHSISDTTGLQSALDGKSNITHTHSLNDISDVRLISPSTGDFLKYVGNKWVNANLPSLGNSSIDDLNDVTITSPSNGQVLSYNGSQWVNTTSSNAVSSIFGRTGAITSQSGDYSTTQVTEGTNLYYTDSRARGSISAGTGISYNSTTGVITNSSPDQTVSLTAGSGIGVTGTYPNFTITNSSPSSGGTVTSVGISVPTGLSITGSPVTTSGTLAIVLDTGYAIPTIAKLSNLDTAYNRSLTAASVSGTTTKTLTLTKQDGNTLTASWTDDNSGTVTSVGLSAPIGFSVSGSPVTGSGTLSFSLATGYSLLTDTTQTIVGAKTFSSAPTITGITSSILKTSSAGVVQAAVAGTDYLTQNQSISVSGDATGSGTTSIALTLSTVNTNVGTFNNVTVNGKGLVTAASNVSYLTANQTISLSGAISGSGTTAITTTLGNSTVGISNLSATGTPSSSTYLRGDNTWASVTGVSDGNKGDITVTGTGSTWTINAGSVTYSDIQNVAANSFLANATGTSSTVQAISTNRIPLFISAITGTPSATTYLRGDGSWQTVSSTPSATINLFNYYNFI